jgi:hypothetical protein
MHRLFYPPVEGRPVNFERKSQMSDQIPFVDAPRNRVSTILAIAAAIGMGVTSVNVQAAPPVDLIVNGNFETGTLSGWTVINTGSGNWAINNGTFDPPGPGEALPPISGAYDAVSYQYGPGFHALRQTINVPNNVFAASLSWSDRIRNYAEFFSDPSQEWRVVIRDTAGNLLQEAFSTNSGDPWLQVGPNLRSSNLTGLLQTYAGQTIVVSFEEQETFYYFNATLDDVKLRVSTLPTNKDQCKGNEWASFINVITGVQIFKNQGDCVSFVETKGKNPPANF